MPDMDRPYIEELPYTQYGRKCIHCKGHLYARILGIAVKQSKERTYIVHFGFVFCRLGHEPPFIPTTREEECLKKSEQSTKEYVYYVN